MLNLWINKSLTYQNVGIDTFCGFYYKHTTIINDDSSIVNKLETSFIYDVRVIIYDCHMFIAQGTVLHGFETISDFQSEVIVIFRPFHNIYYNWILNASKEKSRMFFFPGYCDLSKSRRSGHCRRSPARPASFERWKHHGRLQRPLRWRQPGVFLA